VLVQVKGLIMQSLHVEVQPQSSLLNRVTVT